MLKLNFDEYQKLATKTAGSHRGERKQYATLGIASEAGEIAEIVKHVLYHGHAYDEKHLVEELGDLLWYIAVLANEFELSLSLIAEKNLEKLAKRYPNGFSEERSVNRDK